MSFASAEPLPLPPLTERKARLHARELIALANEHGLTQLAFASLGRMRAHVAEDRDLMDVFAFQNVVRELLGAEVAVLSDGALGNANVSTDLLNAQPL